MGDYSGVPGRPKVQNRTNVMQLKLMGQTHPTGLTPNLLKLFEARPPLEYKPPPEKRKCPPYSGMAQFVSCFAEKDDPVYQQPIEKSETPAQRRERIHKLRLEEGARKAAEELEKYDPHNDPNISGDPYKTLFVAKLNYDTTERNIKREFEAYGPIKRVGIGASQGVVLLLTFDKITNKPRGYAFVEYVHTRDMKAAYKQTDGSKIDNRRVLVDVERGRTVPNWRPRRLGGGLGTTRVGGEDANQKSLGRGDQVQSGGPPRSEEPRARDDRHVDREKSRERGRGDREGEREKSAERSVERPKDRDREDRHHRDRDKNRDRDRERDRGGRDRDRDRRDRGDRGGRERGRESERERYKERDRDRERGDRHRDRGGRDRDYEIEDGEGGGEKGRSSRDKEYDYNQDEPDRHRGDKERNSYDHGEPEDDYERERRYKQHDHGHYEGVGGGRGHYEDSDNHAENNERDRYDQMDEDKYQADGGSNRDYDR